MKERVWANTVHIPLYVCICLHSYGHAHLTPGSCFIACVVKCLLLVADNFDGFPSFVDTIKIMTLPTINREHSLVATFHLSSTHDQERPWQPDKYATIVARNSNRAYFLSKKKRGRKIFLSWSRDMSNYIWKINGSFWHQCLGEYF